MGTGSVGRPAFLSVPPFPRSNPRDCPKPRRLLGGLSCLNRRRGCAANPLAGLARCIEMRVICPGRDCQLINLLPGE
jgi:hypothetical protein